MALEEPWNHGRVDVGEVELHFVTQGGGPLVVLLHGFPEFWYSWRHQIPALAKRFKVVAPDMRGYNLSDKPEGVREYALDKLTGDVKGLIEAFGEKRAHVVGHDWGGAVAWSFAMAYPAFVDKLVVLNAPHPAAFIREITSDWRQVLKSWYMFYFQVPLLPELTLSAFDHYVLRRTFSSWAHDKRTFTEEDIDRLAGAAGQPGALTSGINYYRAMMRTVSLHKPQKEHIAKIESPTLLIWAMDDRALGLDLTYGLEKYFSDGFEVRYIPDCSHWVQQERPVLVNEMLESFL